MALPIPQRRPLTFIAAFAVAFVTLNVGASRISQKLKDERERDLMLLRHAPGATPHYDWSIGENLAQALPAIPDARKAPLVIVSGMSQTYAINDAGEGAKPLPDRLDESLSKRGVRVFGLVAPNLHNEEALLLLNAAMTRAETKPAAWLYGLCFDKLRNVDVRPGMLRFLAKNPDVRTRWAHLCDEDRASFPLACDRIKTTGAHALEEEPKASSVIRVEERVRQMASAAFPLTRDREHLNAAGQGKVYELRNWLFGIKTTTERPILPARYQLNMELLRLSVRVAKRNGIRPIFYIIPLNPEAKAPYRPEEYGAFKKEMQTLADAEQIAFANLEDAVPRGEWGLLFGQPDFKHFRETGHARLSEAIVRTFDHEWASLTSDRKEAGR